MSQIRNQNTRNIKLENRKGVLGAGLGWKIVWMLIRNEVENNKNQVRKIRKVVRNIKQLRVQNLSFLTFTGCCSYTPLPNMISKKSFMNLMKKIWSDYSENISMWQISPEW